MGPGTTFDPVWVLMTMYTILEVVIIALLVMPMPSNKVRGIIQGAVSQLWHTQEYVKRTSWVLLTLNSYYLYDALSNLITHNRIYAATCEAQGMTLFLQRNALICGGSVFLFFVMRRLLDIQGQLFEMRQLVKEAAGQQEVLTQGGPTSPSEQQRRLHKTLTQLDRALSEASGNDNGAPGVAALAVKLLRLWLPQLDVGPGDSSNKAKKREEGLLHHASIESSQEKIVV
eukprot:gene7144-7359_t